MKKKKSLPKKFDLRLFNLEVECRKAILLGTPFRGLYPALWAVLSFMWSYYFGKAKEK